MADKVDNRAFAEMEYATADKTAVNLLGDKSRVTKENVHDMLMVAGFTPALGNIADAADAVLYAVEGEFGSAALSSAAMIPFLGQFVSAKRALKAAKKSGQEIVTLYRGVRGIDDVDVMVKNGKVVGNWGKTFNPDRALNPSTMKWAGPKRRKPLDSVLGPQGPIISSVPENVNIKNTLFTTWQKKTAELYKDKGGMVLEFEVPKSWINKHGRDAFGRRLSREGQGWGTSIFKKSANMSYPSVIFTEGLPTGFLKNVHKYSQESRPVW